MCGHGISELMDAGQWFFFRAAYEHQALRDEILFTDTRDDLERFRGVLRKWELTLAAGEEMAKFLPDDADEVPSSAFWTDVGRALRRPTSTALPGRGWSATAPSTCGACRPLSSGTAICCAVRALCCYAASDAHSRWLGETGKPW